VAAPDAAPAGGKAGHGSIGARIGLYKTDDKGDGNPFLDETETVVEPVIIFDYNVTDRLSVSAQLSYDHVSSASIDRLSKFPEQSGASGDYYVGGLLGLRYDVSDRVRIGVNAGGSFEYDYRSFGGGADVELDLNDKNTTIRAGLVAYLDQVRVIRFDGREDEGDEARTSVTINLGLYQVLTPTLHGEIGYSLGIQSGFLETAFNAVVIEDPALPPNPNLDNRARGREITEELPDMRLRHSIHGRLRQYFPSIGGSVELGARFYFDNWGVASVAIEPRFHYWIVKDVLLARLRYRFYAQTASRFYDDHFRAEEKERTQDSDLGAFSSHSLGLKLTFFVTENMSFDVSGDYVLRSDGLDQIIGAVGWRWNF
jgi:hypothetical protein